MKVTGLPVVAIRKTSFGGIDGGCSRASSDRRPGGKELVVIKCERVSCDDGVVVSSVEVDPQHRQKRRRSGNVPKMKNAARGTVTNQISVAQYVVTALTCCNIHVDNVVKRALGCECVNEPVAGS